VYNWQVFESDEDILNFIQCVDNYDSQVIDFNNLIEVIDGKETIFGNEILQLPTNEIPKGLTELEGLFTDNDSHMCHKSPAKLDDFEEINLGSESSPRIVYIGKKLAPHVRTNLISLLKRFKHVFAWSYEDLKAYREDLFQHEIPLKDDVKPFRQK
jgi:hypothetical protein